jgi:spore coat polysaccharide biosynthesis protein SpsF
MKTEQEEFWSGAFGNDYIDRNASDALLAANISLFSKIVQSAGPLSSVLELGCNIGMNLRALRRLLPNCELAGVEINQAAAEKLKEWGEAQVYLDSILEVELDRKFDLTFTKGVLIHINPDYLDQVYRRLYDYSSKYICVAEYYNPTPVELSYRGHSGRLFKRDFAGEILQRYQDLELVDYGFVYHKDPVFPQDDISWFLLKKT